jgi:hypothetical protein
MKNFTRFFVLVIACLILSILMNRITAFDPRPDQKAASYSGTASVEAQHYTDNLYGLVQSETKAVITALKTGNSVLLARYFDNRVDISMPAKSDNYSKKQAEMIMKDFFDQNIVKTFELKHSGENKDGSQFFTGVLHTREHNFRTILFMKPKGSKLLLQQLSLQELE